MLTHPRKSTQQVQASATTAATTTRTPGRVIRSATPADLQYVYQLQNRLHRLVGYTPKGGLVDRIDSHRMIIVEENGDPAGYVTFTHRRDGRTHLPQIAVDPHIWNTKAGTELMTRLVADANHVGSYAITLKSAIDLDVNTWWGQHGFKPQHVEQTNRRTLVHWAKRLRPSDPHPILAPQRHRPPGGIRQRATTTT